MSMGKRGARTKPPQRQKKSLTVAATDCSCDEYFRVWTCKIHGGSSGNGWIPEDGNALRLWAYSKNVMGRWMVTFHDGLCCEVPTENKARLIVAEFREAVEIVTARKLGFNQIVKS